MLKVLELPQPEREGRTFGLTGTLESTWDSGQLAAQRRGRAAERKKAAASAMSIYLKNTPGMIEYELGNDDTPPPIDNNNRCQSRAAAAWAKSKWPRWLYNDDA